MHPVETIKSHKRKSPDAHAGPSKRKRTGQETGDDDVIVITDDEEEEEEEGPARRPTGGSDTQQRNEPENLNFNEVLKVFQIDGKSLK